MTKEKCMENKEIWRKAVAGLKNIFAGIVIGISNVIPGVSGGTMAVVLNVYDEILDAVSIRRFVKHLFFIITLGIGMLAGIYGFSNIIEYLFENYPMQTNFAFLGLILGSIPMIFKRSLKEKFQPVNLIPFIAGLGIMVVLFLFGNQEGGQTVMTQMDVGTFLLMILAGAVAAFAMVLPGISGSMIMVIMGTYTTVISAVSNLNFLFLLPVVIGVVIGIVVCIKMVKYLMKRFYQGTYFAILGLVLGSVLSLWPGFIFDIQGLVSILLMLAAAVIAYLFSRSEKDENDETDGDVPEGAEE